MPPLFLAGCGLGAMRQKGSSLQGLMHAALIRWNASLMVQDQFWCLYLSLEISVILFSLPRSDRLDDNLCKCLSTAWKQTLTFDVRCERVEVP